MMPHINPFWPKHSFKFKGAKPTTAAQEQSSIIAPPPAPPVATAGEVLQAKTDARRQASKKQGINSTILGRGYLGGSEGGNAMAPSPKSTLLGGG